MMRKNLFVEFMKDHYRFLAKDFYFFIEYYLRFLMKIISADDVAFLRLNEFPNKHWVTAVDLVGEGSSELSSFPVSHALPLEPVDGSMGALVQSDLPNGQRQYYFMVNYTTSRGDVMGAVVFTLKDVLSSEEVALAKEWCEIFFSALHFKHTHDKRAELVRGALRDPVTGLLNRRSCDHILGRVPEYVENNGSSQFWFLMFDIDLFKSLNDAYGHPVGDKVLGLLGGILSSFVPDAIVTLLEGSYEAAQDLHQSAILDALHTHGGWLPFRVGGEEIFLLASGSEGTIRQLISRAQSDFSPENVARAVGEPITWNPSFSAGVKLVSNPQQLSGEWKATDTLLYAAKENRGSIVIR